MPLPVIVVIVGALLAYFLKNRQDTRARVSAANAATLKQIEPAYGTVLIKASAAQGAAHSLFVVASNGFNPQLGHIAQLRERYSVPANKHQQVQAGLSSLQDLVATFKESQALLHGRSTEKSVVTRHEELGTCFDWYIEDVEKALRGNPNSLRKTSTSLIDRSYAALQQAIDYRRKSLDKLSQ